MNSTRTCVTPPLEPVRPRTLVTLASLTGATFMVTAQGDRPDEGEFVGRLFGERNKKSQIALP